MRCRIHWARLLSADVSHQVDWFGSHASGVECSSRGNCDRTSGVCTCDDNFEGEACRVQVHCGRLVNSLRRKGRCILWESSLHRPTRTACCSSHLWPLAPTWDYNKIYGCYCDRNVYHGPLEGDYVISGYDCSKFMCPFGDDPETRGQSEEVQVVHCTATGGSLTLTFREKTTSSIAFDATAADVEAALELLTSIKTLAGVGVTVSYSGTAFCTADGSNAASITFKQLGGDSRCCRWPLQR